MTQDNLLDVEDLPPQADPNKDYLTELVGEGKKFKDQQALAKSKWESDNYIKILERRLDETIEDSRKVREDSDTRAKLSDLIQQMKSQREEQLASSTNTQANEVQQKPIDQKDIESLVSSKIQEHEMTKRQTDNFNMVKDKLQQRYGNNYKEAVNQQIDELGITEQELNDLARKSPKMLIKTLGLEEKQLNQTFQAPPRSVSNQTSFAPNSPRERTWSYYQELKQKTPNAWLDRNTAVQMQKDALELGDKFYDGDFYKPGLHER